MLIEIAFWFCFSLIVYTYLVYPLIMFVLAAVCQQTSVNKLSEEVPVVSILMSVHNEEAVIEEKMQSLLAIDYPVSKIEILIGSDASTDNTLSILSPYAAKNKIQLYPFKARLGKPEIINQLAQKAGGIILVITDANVILDPKCIGLLAGQFNNPRIGLADTHMINKGLQKEGISIQESTYISYEVKLKHNESKVWGTMMGPFGGCYAIRKDLYKNIPKNHLVDDFYLNMRVIEQGYGSTNVLDALVYEDVSNSISEEFRRKVRISTGNFQNLRIFSCHLLRPFSKAGFCFISHKVLRWLVPFFYIALFTVNIYLAFSSNFYRVLLFIQLGTLLLPLIEYLLRKIGIHIVILRFVTHFVAMNVALFWGFIKLFEGVESNAWQPTQRNQTTT